MPKKPKWTDEDTARLIRLKDEKKKTWQELEVIFGRKNSTLHYHYKRGTGANEGFGHEDRLTRAKAQDCSERLLKRLRKFHGDPSRLYPALRAGVPA